MKKIDAPMIWARAQRPYHGASTAAVAVLLFLVQSTIGAQSAGHGSDHHRAHGPSAEPPVQMVRMGGMQIFDGPAPEPGSYALPPIRAAADGAVLLSSGQSSTLHKVFGDRLVLLSFVFTSCKDVCPVATSVLHRIHRETRKVPELAERLRLVTISFDPERDTPEVMADYSAVAGKGSDWLFLTTASRQALRPLLRTYDQQVTPEYDEAGNFTGDFSHVLRLYLIDGEQRIRNIYSASYLSPSLLLADVRTLALEGERRHLQRASARYSK